MEFFQRKETKQWGWVIMALMLGFAAGNAHQTSDAIKGDARYWQQRCHAALMWHQSQDIQKYGW